MKMDKKKILIIDDEESMRHMLSLILKKEGYEVFAVNGGKEALDLLSSLSFDFILSDIIMPEMDGLQLLQALKERKVESTIIMMSAYGTINTAIEAMKRGAYDYISKPFRPDEILLALRKAEERENLREENIRLRKEVLRQYSFGNIIGQSPRMLDIFELISRFSEYKTSILILGESGTGKELVARCLHYNSPRSKAPFITVNCGAIPETLLESELFGHEKGAFTDAKKEKRGSFEMAHEGTLFLDEVGELSPSAQVKLLRALQEGEIKRLGSERPINVDVRIIAATVKDLNKEVACGKFREDLFYRLNVLQINLPPLRERKEDIPLLIEHFIQKFNERHKLNIEGISAEALAFLLDYHWPGNVRELENIIERAIILSHGRKIEAEYLPSEIVNIEKKRIKRLSEEEISIKKATRLLEEELIRKALQKTEGNRTQAAKILEISHPSLLSKIKEYGIED